MSLGIVSSVFLSQSISCARTSDTETLQTATTQQHQQRKMRSLQIFLGLSLLVIKSGSIPQFSSNRFDQQQFRGGSCPEKNGRFVHNNQCDAYIECIDGVPEEKLCPDGLLFNPDARFGYPCGYPVNVNCEGRTSVQPAQATDECPHSYGYFRTPDVRNCGQFINCVEGKAHVFDCPLGLAFNEATLQCDWPDQVPSCDAEAFLGFTCPAPQGSFLARDYELYRSQSDCTKYFVCLNGRPRLLACPEGTGFSEEVGDCVDAETIPGCAVRKPNEPAERFPVSSRFGKK